jgi:hypothetical protein
MHELWWTHVSRVAEAQCYTARGMVDQFPSKDSVFGTPQDERSEFDSCRGNPFTANDKSLSSLATS